MSGVAMLRTGVMLSLMLASSLMGAEKPAATSAANARKIVQQIQRADYRGDRPALKFLYDDLAPFKDDKEIGSRILYWRGFALWRRAINGFNESTDAKDLEHDLTVAMGEFDEASTRDP